MVGLPSSDGAQVRWTEPNDQPFEDKGCGHIEPRGGYK